MLLKNYPSFRIRIRVNKNDFINFYLSKSHSLPLFFFINVLDSHEMTGIFFKYDVNPLQVIIREEEYTFLQLILRICSCAGGLYIVASE